MPTISPEVLLAQLHWRYATKKFDPAKKIPAELWSTLEEAIVLSPSSYGLQPWKFVVVTDQAMRAKLHPAAYNQAQILDCSHLVVVCSKSPPTVADVDQYIARIAKLRGVPTESLDGYHKMMAAAVSRETSAMWAARQAYIALGVLVTSAALLGVDVCPMEGFDNAKFDEILDLKSHGVTSLALAAAGYRAGDDKYGDMPKVRFPVEDVIVRI